MSGTIVRIDELSDAIKNEIDALNKEVIEKCNEAAEHAAKEGVSELKSSSPVRTDGFKRKYPPGSYAQSWTKKKESEHMGINVYTLHNAKHYQLTHLLEFGHIIAGTGRRSKAMPHVAPVNEKVSQQFVEEVEDMDL